MFLWHRWTEDYTWLPLEKWTWEKDQHVLHRSPKSSAENENILTDEWNNGFVDKLSDAASLQLSGWRDKKTCTWWKSSITTYLSLTQSPPPPSVTCDQLASSIVNRILCYSGHSWHESTSLIRKMALHLMIINNTPLHLLIKYRWSQQIYSGLVDPIYPCKYLKVSWVLYM